MAETSISLASDDPCSTNDGQGACVSQGKIVFGVHWADEAVPAVRALHGAQNDFLAHAEARLADVMRRGDLIVARLEEQGKSAGLDFVQSEALLIKLLLLELSQLRLQTLVLKGELRRGLMDSQEAG